MRAVENLRRKWFRHTRDFIDPWYLLGMTSKIEHSEKNIP